MADLRCEDCGRLMTVEFRIPRLGKPGLCHDYYSCECGYITSRAQEDSEFLQAAEREVAKMRLRLNSDFLRWARRTNQVPAPALPPKLVD
jgi:hypothetical protein